MDEFKRREFLSGLVGIALVSSAGMEGLERPMDTNKEMPMRNLGKTGQRVSCIGLGGFHLGKPPVDEQGAINLFRAAVDRGINFSDNSWDYNDGESERRIGRALKNGYREKVFVMTKFDGRTKNAALAQLDESLRRLDVHHIDLWQFHENIRLEDPDRFFAVGGAVEAVNEARKAGKIRFVGFTGHKDPAVHLRMFELAERHDFHFDTVQMPLNVMDAHFRSLEKNVIPAALKQGVGILGMKPFGDTHILESKVVEPIQCLQYALHLPTSVVITGIDSMDRLNQAFEAANSYSRLTASDFDAILRKTAAAAATGKFEPFKTSAMFDSTARNPQWLG
jgi:aryl-alcohol dehydrogenase-like predicted oxidoreductase